MSDDAFDRVFGGGARTRPSFSQRVVQAERFGERIDPRPAMGIEAATVATAPGEYRAFGFMPSGNINLACEVRWWMEGTTIPEGLAFPYRLMMQVGFSGDDTLRILLPDTVVQIEGSHLDALRQALMRQQVTFIQQFHAKIWSNMGSGNDTIVERIELHKG